MLLSKLATYIFDTVLELAKEDEVGIDDAAPELLSEFMWSLAGWPNSPIPTPTPILAPSTVDDLYAVFVDLVLICVYIVLNGVLLWIILQLLRAAPALIESKPTMHEDTEQVTHEREHEPAQSEYTTPTCAVIQQPIAIPAGKPDPRTAEEEYALLRAMLHAILPAPPGAPLENLNPNTNPTPPPRTTTPPIPGPPAPSPFLAPEPANTTPIPMEPSTPLPAFASPEITCSSTPRLAAPPSPSSPSSPRLPRTTRLARRLLHLGAARVASAEELRVLYKWARIPASGAPPGYTDEDGAQDGLERDEDATAVEDSSNIGVGRSPLLGEEKMRMWRGRRWAR
ncbi:hypothetical protein DFH06DRAFT_1471699 [Mycena polygramma]|nr:hypothetical protein DFH06DRAFT_1471699 [Mycena polygramma]